MRDVDRGKFVRLANARVNKVLNGIRLIGNLSNRSNYDYTKSDVDRIFRAIIDETKACRERFEDRDRTGNRQFKLE